MNKGSGQLETENRNETIEEKMPVQP